MKSSTDEQDRGLWATLRLLFEQAFAERSLIEPATYAAYNILLGGLLLLASGLVRVEPAKASLSTALTLAGVALGLISGLLIAPLWPNAARSLLALQGALVLALGMALAVGSIQWSYTARAHAPFRYAPGLSLVLCLYGTLQVADFGPFRRLTSRLRKSGLVLGFLAEAAVATALLLRLLRAPLSA